jgi:hypothetical protein
MNLKKIIPFILALALMPEFAVGSSYLIDAPTQIKPGVIQTIVKPSFDAIAVSTAGLRTALTLETTTRIAADSAEAGTRSAADAAQVGRLNALDVATATLTSDFQQGALQFAAVAFDTTTLKGQIDAVAASTGVTKITAGTNITISPLSGLGDVTINAAGGSGVLETSSPTWTGQHNFTTNVGFGVVSPSTAIDVLGTVNATAFIGDGSGLTNLPATGVLTTSSPTWTGEHYFSNSIRYTDGNEANGKVLTSSALGFATWQTPVVGTSFTVDASPTVNTCFTATSCVAHCAVGKVLGGGCSTSPMVSPTQGFPFNSTDYECDAGVTANITAYAVCGH